MSPECLPPGKAERELIADCVLHCFTPHGSLPPVLTQMFGRSLKELQPSRGILDGEISTVIKNGAGVTGGRAIPRFLFFVLFCGGDMDRHNVIGITRSRCALCGADAAA